MNQINVAADAAPEMLRLSMDAKATVKVGPFARGGKSRSKTTASDHDFKPEATVTPVGIFLPATDELFVYEVTSKVTSDCLLDCLWQWWETVQDRFAHITTLVINLDNGPENHSRRTQFMHRVVEFVRQTNLTVRLAYTPESHTLTWSDFFRSLIELPRGLRWGWETSRKGLGILLGLACAGDRKSVV